MANRHRGEIDATIDGVTCRLCLTLGALAELEAAFGVGDLAALAGRLGAGQLAARDILLLIACGLRGGGQAVSDTDVAAMTFEGGLAGAVRVAAELVAVTFGTAAAHANPQRP